MVGAGVGAVGAGAFVASACEEINGMFVLDVGGTAGFDGEVAGLDGGRVGGAWRPGWARRRSNSLVVR